MSVTSTRTIDNRVHLLPTTDYRLPTTYTRTTTQDEKQAEERWSENETGDGSTTLTWILWAGKEDQFITEEIDCMELALSKILQTEIVSHECTVSSDPSSPSMYTCETE